MTRGVSITGWRAPPFVLRCELGWGLEERRGRGTHPDHPGVQRVPRPASRVSGDLAPQVVVIPRASSVDHSVYRKGLSVSLAPAGCDPRTDGSAPAQPFPPRIGDCTIVETRLRRRLVVPIEFRGRDLAKEARDGDVQNALGTGVGKSSSDPTNWECKSWTHSGPASTSRTRVFPSSVSRL